MSLIRPALLFAALLALASAARAHDDATLDSVKAPHQGQLRMAGIYHYELVVDPAARPARPAPVRVYVTDHAGARIATVGATGTATLLNGASKTSVMLRPEGDNGMKGEGAYAAGPDLKVIVSITLPGKAAEAARFTPLAQAASESHGQHK
jgi:hypothetical protein